MGNSCCAESRGTNKFQRMTRATQVYLRKAKNDINQSYTEIKQEAREKYEEAKFKIELQKHEKQFSQDSFLSKISPRKGTSKFQHELFKFEQSFPLAKLDINQFECRLKSLAQGDEFIKVSQLVESFKTCAGMEDIVKEDSLIFQLLTNDQLKQEYENAFHRSKTRLSMIQQSGPNKGLTPQKSERPSFNHDDQSMQLFIPYLMCLGILFCKATPRQRATKFFQICQMDLTPHVCNTDKELKDYFGKMMKLSTFYISQVYMLYQTKDPLDMLEFQNDPIFKLNAKQLEDLREPIFEVFLDKVFGSNCRVDTADFINMMSLEHTQYFLPNFIRGQIVLFLDDIATAATTQN